MLSEVNTGTDAANQKRIASRDGDRYLLPGAKVWVANAVVADVLLIFAATEPGIGGRGVSAFLVPSDAPGLTRTATHDSLGVRGLGSMDLALDDVAVSADAMVGEAGQGFRVAMWTLDGGRIAIGSQALAHAWTRKTFGQPIAGYQAIQWMLANMAPTLTRRGCS